MQFAPDIERALGTLDTQHAAATRRMLADAVERNARIAALDGKVAQIARRQAEARAATDAAINNVGKRANPLAGMKPTTAIVGAVAVGAVAMGGIKFMQRRREKAEQRSWAQRIEQERALAAQRGGARQL